MCPFFFGLVQMLVFRRVHQPGVPKAVAATTAQRVATNASHPPGLPSRENRTVKVTRRASSEVRPSLQPMNASQWLHQFKSFLPTTGCFMLEKVGTRH